MAMRWIFRHGCAWYCDGMGEEDLTPKDSGQAS